MVLYNTYVSISRTARIWKVRIFDNERDALFLLSSRCVQISNSFVTSILLIKKFGIESVGTYTIAYIAITILSLVCSLGLNYSLPQSRLSNRQRTGVASSLLLFALPGVAAFIFIYSCVVSRSPAEIIQIALFSSVGYFMGWRVVLNTLLLLDGQTHLAIIPPLVNSIFLIISALLAHSVSHFALLLVAGWSIGTLYVLYILGCAKVDYKMVLFYGKRGIQYLPTDLMSLLSEQSVILIIAHFLTRSDLGCYGLCRQVVTLADTPGWSFVQSKYPSLVHANLSHVKNIENINWVLSIVMSICSLLVSCLLGTFVYNLPWFWLMMMIVCLSMPYRYANNLYDQIMKAMGRAVLCTYLASAKLVLALLICTPFVMYFHLWGAIFSLTIISFIAGLLYRKKATGIIYSIR